VPDVCEQPRGEESSNAQKAVALIVFGNWGVMLSSARGK
jgi:hypothetical protein